MDHVGHKNIMNVGMPSVLQGCKVVVLGKLLKFGFVGDDLCAYNGPYMTLSHFGIWMACCGRRGRGGWRKTNTLEISRNPQI